MFTQVWDQNMAPGILKLSTKDFCKILQTVRVSGASTGVGQFG